MSSTESTRSHTQVVAVPVANGQLCGHFGHCENFALYDVDPQAKEMLGSRLVEPPPHEPGVLPRWLHDQGVSVILAGGMGRRAQDIFAAHDIQVIVGLSAGPPDTLVQSYLDGQLQPAGNPCDH